MTAAFPGANSGYIQGFAANGDATGKLIVNFSRNVKDFPLNNWITLTNVARQLGLYLRITVEEAARIIQADLDDFVWPDGADVPDYHDEESFEFKPFVTTRRAYPFRIGYLAAEQADWQLVAQHAGIKSAKAMTGRAVATIAVASNTSNYDASHTSTATSLGGGFLSAGTITTPYTMKVLQQAATQINIDTLGVVGPKDLVVVINPNLAQAIARSAEVHNFLAQSPAAMAQVRGDVEGWNSLWGLPNHLYGFKIIVEDTVRATTRKKTTAATKGYALGDNTMMILARPGGLTSNEGGVSFSTVHIFSKEELTVETKDDPDNRRHLGRVVDDFQPVVVAPASGYIVTACLS